MDFVLVEKGMSPAYFKQVERIYLDSFPVSQIRPSKMIIRMLEFDPNYYLLVAREDYFIVGFTLVYAFNELDLAILDFMAIDKTYRNRGVGCNLFRYTINTSKRLVTNSIGLIFEVERESTIEHNKHGLRHRRVLFYKRHGAKALDNVHCMLPDLHRELAYLEKGFVFRVIKSIYLSMYNYHDESNFLDLAIDGLPPKIRLI